jgi:apolipoprotein N-acyltransferase
MVLAFEPFAYGVIAFISLSVLLYFCRNSSARNSFWYGLAFALGEFGFGVSWVYVSLHTYGGMPLWMGSIAVVLFAGILSIFTALACFSAAKLVPQEGYFRLLILSVSYVLFEWLKSWILTGFAWLELGVTQTSTWLFSLAPLGGVYLISLTVTLVAMNIVVLLCYRNKVAAITLILLVLAGTKLADSLVWSSPDGDSLRIGIVQGNIPINEKWQSEYRQGVVDKLSRLSNQLAFQEQQKESPLDLLVWPETALPIYVQQTDKDFWRSIQPQGIALVTGLVDNPSQSKSYNAAVLSCGDSQQIYRKRHLVPFGEYLPMRFLFNWILEYLQLPMSDFSSWAEPQSLQCAGNIKIGLSICYEDAFGTEIRENTGDATVLVNISEDAWFGDSLAPHQRLQMGQMRARELARPMVRSANSGPSAFIDERGAVVLESKQFEDQILALTIQPMTGDTLYKRYGNWVLIFCMLFIGLAILRRVRAKRN